MPFKDPRTQFLLDHLAVANIPDADRRDALFAEALSYEQWPVEFWLSEVDRNGDRVTPGTFEQVESALSKAFGEFTMRRAEGQLPTSAGERIRETVRIYEVLIHHTEKDARATADAAEDIAHVTRQQVVYSIDGKRFLTAASNESHPLVSLASPLVVQPSSIEPPHVSGWPATFDVGIVAVIPQELHATLDSFPGRKSDARPVEGSVYYRRSATRSGHVSVVLHCQGQQANVAAGIATERLINAFRPRLMFLVGVAAGRQAKVRIGDVVTSRAVVDDTTGVVVDGQIQGRPEIMQPPYAGMQLLQSYRHDRARWLRKLSRRASAPSVTALETELSARWSVGVDEVRSWFLANVATEPRAEDGAVYSSNFLLKDEEVLSSAAQNLHQQIRVGEMEAAGFAKACFMREKPVPFLVVRAVSDFGNDRKVDDCFAWAAHSAATYAQDVVSHLVWLGPNIQGRGAGPDPV